MAKELNEIVTIIVDMGTGNIDLDVSGSDGKSCTGLTAGFEDAIGNNVKRTWKQEAIARLKLGAKKIISATR